MIDIPPRCPFCANVLKIEASFWARLGFKPGKEICPTCQRDFEGRDAHTMGTQYWNWAELFRAHLTEVLETAPVWSESAAMRALGNPQKNDTRTIATLEELVRSCLRYHRTALIEMARGREASLEVVPLKQNATGKLEAVAILSTTSVESGGQQHEQIVARTGMGHFVLFTYTGPDGAEARVKRAFHESAHGVSVEAQAVEAKQASGAPVGRHA